MKLSSRKELLKESDIILREIRKNIYKEKLNEGIVKDFFKKIIDAISISISKWIVDKQQKRAYKKRGELWIEMPYLLGIDLIKKSELDIDYTHLKRLEKMMKDFYFDIKNSNDLKKSIEDITKVGRSIIGWEPQPGDVSTYNIIDKRKDYHDYILGVIRPIVQKTLKYKKYKNFEKMVMDEIQKGVKGLTPEQYRDIQERYFIVLYDRVAQYVRKYDIQFRVGMTASQ
jgi:hypothetical protein